MGERGYRALESEYKRINEYFQLARKTSGQDWPMPDDERTLSPAEQNKLEIHFGVITPDPDRRPRENENQENARKR